MLKIPFNPYIVGNPIKTKEMFFGREDDFGFVTRKIGEGRTNQIIVFCGERRSGKTSILFQILGGRLGKDFLPVLIDMQILAGIRNDFDLFRNFMKTACDTLSHPEFTIENLERRLEKQSVEDLFDSFFRLVEEHFPKKTILFLLDEYELIEAKIKDGTLSENAVHYLAGLLESRNRVSFIFTGSTNLEDRKVGFWKSLLGKSIYRKISYLSKRDTYRLITEPLQQHITYPEEVVASIYRLTGGQPFYTQVICQNMVDLLMEEEKDNPAKSDLETIVRDIIDNPLPQMIYSWNNLSQWSCVILSSSAAVLEGPEAWTDPASIHSFLKSSKLAIPFKRERINILLEEAYHREFLEKQKEDSYRFKMDLFRRWIKREHSLWQVAKEVSLAFRKPLRWIARAFSAAGVVAAVVVVWFVVVPLVTKDGGTLETEASEMNQEQPVEETPQPVTVEMTLVSNREPFRVLIDGSLNLTSEGQEDGKTIKAPSLEEGKHTFVFHDPSSGEKIEKEVRVSPENAKIEITFTKAVPKKPAKETAVVSEAPEKESSEENAGAPAPGAVFLNSDPPGAFILVNGELMADKTPNLIENLAPGEYTIELINEGYKNEKLVLLVEEKKTVKEEVKLSPTFGTITLDIRPTAKVYLDGEFLVDTPYAKPIEVQTGKHVLTLKNESLGVEEEIAFKLEEGDKKSFTRELKK